MTDVNLLFNSSSEIFHHGIEGQKWGIRNGPPYPLDRDNAGRIKKEAKKDFKLAKKNMLYNDKYQKVKIGARFGASYALKEDANFQALLSLLTDKDARKSIDEVYGENGATKMIIGTALNVILAEFIVPYAATKTAEYIRPEWKTAHEEYIKDVKDAQNKYKIAKKYAKLATKQELTEKDIQILNEMKKELNLK